MIYRTDADFNLKSMHCRELSLAILYQVEMAVEYCEKMIFLSV